MHIPNPLEEPVKQKWEELNDLNKEEGPNLGYFPLCFIILRDICIHFVIEKIILLFQLCPAACIAYPFYSANPTKWSNTVKQFLRCLWGGA